MDLHNSWGCYLNSCSRFHHSVRANLMIDVFTFSLLRRPFI
ncbi:hypothetical protein Gohar_011485 [Gossypium harknessii]|uniref:Uncharacterized protein n=1 Tax=Gossypium harknessii TaxID=34285 RepID=A0A7J9GU35_9ROSI|nr:hypothetical protein [Gossypium harknessii]